MRSDARDKPWAGAYVLLACLGPSGNCFPQGGARYFPAGILAHLRKFRLSHLPILFEYCQAKFFATASMRGTGQSGKKLTGSVYRLFFFQVYV
jgi:hypothetical protein